MENIYSSILWLTRKLKEPSSYAAIAAVSAMLGNKIDPGTLDTVLNGITIVTGFLGFFLHEQQPLTKVDK